MKNMKKILDLLVEGINVIGLIFEDGKLSLSDAAKLLRLMDEVKALSGLDFNEVAEEIENLNDEDIEEIKTYVIEKLDIPQDEIEKKIEAVFKLLASLPVLVKEIMVTVKQIKG